MVKTCLLKTLLPLHYNKLNFSRNKSSKTDLLKQGLMLSPFSEDQIKLKNSNITNMSFVYINDYGGRIEQVIRF